MGVGCGGGKVEGEWAEGRKGRMWFVCKMGKKLLNKNKN